jgi:hypothetical protein
MDRSLMTWTSRDEVDGGTVVNYTGVVLSRDLGGRRQGSAFARATFDRLAGVLDLYASDAPAERPTASVKLRLVAVTDHDDLVTHAPTWRKLFDYMLSKIREGTHGRPDNEDRDDLAYWEHELKTFERRVARARAES